MGDVLSVDSDPGAGSRPSEDEFIGLARSYLTRVAGVAEDRLDPDVDLVASNVIDSLTLVEFFAFIEEQRGSPIEPESVSLDSLSTIRKAYALVAS